MTIGATATANLRAREVEPSSRILLTNLRAALAIAVEELRRKEARLSPHYCSAMRRGWEANLAAIRAGQSLQIIED